MFYGKAEAKMSHEIVGSDKRLVYTMPAWPSDVLRSREFNEFFKPYRGPSFSVQTRDGWYWFSCPVGHPVFTASFSSREKLDGVIGESTESSLARVFLEGDLDVQGDISALLCVAEYVLRHSNGFSRTLIQILSRASVGWFKGLKDSPVSASGSKWRTTEYPADLPVSFFQPWLGSALAHSCAQFRNTKDDLATAQKRGMEKVCEDLEITGNDRLLDLSCGWGSLLVHAAGQHGIEGRGIALSEQQAVTATERIWRNNLERQCTAECRDLAAAPPGTNTFQKIADISLFDQILSSHFQEYLTSTYNLLTPGGMLLLHRITRRSRSQRNTAGHIEASPTNEHASLSDELQLAESSGFHVVSLRDLSNDLRRSLRLWIEQLQGSIQSRSAPRYRHWLFHLLDTATNLEAGNVQFHQILLCREPFAPEN